MEQPMIILSKISGVPVTDRNSPKISTTIRFISLIFAFIFITISVYRYFITQYDIVNNCKLVCQLGEVIIGCLMCMLYFVSIIKNVLEKNIHNIFISIIDEIDYALDICFLVDNKNNIEKKSYKENRFQFILVFVGVTLYFVIFSFQVYIFYGDDLIEILILIIGSFIPTFSSCMVQAQFICLIHKIACRYEQSNRVLERICEEAEPRNDKIKIFDIETQFDNIDEKDGVIKSEKNKGIIEKNVNSERFLVVVFRVHNRLCELGVITNAAYSLQIVSFMTSTFIISVFSVFLLTKIVFLVGGKNQSLDMLSITYVLLTVYLIMISYMVLRICCRAQNEAKRSALLIHEIMQKKPAFMLGNDVYYNKMKAFTLQYMHWENYFHFNGIGLFRLDYTFIFSTVSAATSYLIVLLQFDLSTIL